MAEIRQVKTDYDVYVSRLKVVEKANKIEEAKLEEQRLEQLKIVQEKKAALELEMKQKKAEEASFNKLNNPDMKGMMDVKDENKVKLGTDFNATGR